MWGSRVAAAWESMNPVNQKLYWRSDSGTVRSRCDSGTREQEIQKLFVSRRDSETVVSCSFCACSLAQLRKLHKHELARVPQHPYPILFRKRIWIITLYIPSQDRIEPLRVNSLYGLMLCIAGG